MRLRIVAVVMAAFPLVAQAGSRGGVTLPDDLELAGKHLVLNGMGVREATVFKVDVYVAGLYLEKKAAAAAEIVAARQVTELVMHFVHDVSAADLKKAFREGFEKNSRDKLPALDSRIAQLESAMRDVAVGDRIVFTYSPAAGTTVSVKGHETAVISGADFAGALWAVFVGDHPPNEGLRTGLLGK